MPFKNHCGKKNAHNNVKMIKYWGKNNKKKKIKK